MIDTIGIKEEAIDTTKRKTFIPTSKSRSQLMLCQTLINMATSFFGMDFSGSPERKDN
jgi:hypothetical protein